MKPFSDLVPAAILGGMNPFERPVREDARLLPDSEYLRCVAKAIKYLSLYSAHAPDVAGMSPEERQRYVLGYGLPFVRAGIPSDALWVLGPEGRGGIPGEALVRWTERPGESFFPKHPGTLLELCEVVMRDRAPGWTPPLALEGPSIGREEWIKRSNETRAKMDLPPLREESPHPV